MHSGEHEFDLEKLRLFLHEHSVRPELVDPALAELEPYFRRVENFELAREEDLDPDEILRVFTRTLRWHFSHPMDRIVFVSLSAPRPAWITETAFERALSGVSDPTFEDGIVAWFSPHREHALYDICQEMYDLCPYARDQRSGYSLSVALFQTVCLVLQGNTDLFKDTLRLLKILSSVEPLVGNHEHKGAYLCIVA